MSSQRKTPPSRPRRLGTALVLVLLLVSFPVTMRFVTRALLYHPTVGQTATPADVGLAFEAVELEAADGVRTIAWWVPGADGGRTVLFLHGNAGNLSNRVPRLRALHDAGVSVLALDYRGYGLSEGRPTPAGLALDARAAWEHVVGARARRPSDVVVFGSSLGAAVALELAGAIEPVRVVLEAPFLSVRAMAREAVPFAPTFLVPNWHDNVAAIARVDVPITIFHGTADRVVPPEHGRALAAASERAELRLVEGAGHHALAPDVARGAFEQLRGLLRAPDDAPAVGKR